MTAADGVDDSYAESILGDSGRARAVEAAFSLGMDRVARMQIIKMATARPRGVTAGEFGGIEVDVVICVRSIFCF